MKFPLKSKSLKGLFRPRETKDALKIEITPYRDWKVVGEVFFVLLVVLVAAHIYLFIRLQDETLFASQEEEPVIGFKKERVLTTVEYYQTRAAKFEERKGEKPNVVDPAQPR